MSHKLPKLQRIYLEDKTKIKAKDRGRQKEYIKNRINYMKSEDYLYDLSLLSKELNQKDLMRIIDTLANHLKIPVAREYFKWQTQRINEANKKFTIILRSTQKFIKAIKNPKIKDKLTLNDLKYINSKKNEKEQEKAIKEYTLTEEFVLERKLEVDKSYINKSLINQRIFEVSKKLKSFSVNKLIRIIKREVKKEAPKTNDYEKLRYSDNVLKIIIQQFLEKGILLKKGVNPKDFIKKCRRELIYGQPKKIEEQHKSKKPTNSTEIKKLQNIFEIYPFEISKINDSMLLKFNKYYNKI